MARERNKTARCAYTTFLAHALNAPFVVDMSLLSAIEDYIRSKAYRCEHEWVLLERIARWGSTKDAFPSFHINLFYCKKCGDEKKYSTET